MFFRLEPFRVIAALELLGSLLGLMLLVPASASEATSIGSVGLAASTDNQGNSRLLEKHMSTKLPLAFVLLELSSQLQARSMTLDLRWLARDLNQPADDLTNFKFDGFTPGLRVPAVWSDLKFMILHLLADDSISFTDTLEAFRAAGAGPLSSSGTPRAKGEKLRTRDPW